MKKILVKHDFNKQKVHFLNEFKLLFQKAIISGNKLRIYNNIRIFYEPSIQFSGLNCFGILKMLNWYLLFDYP